MTPKEKARELMKSMSFLHPSIAGMEMGEIVLVPENPFAKECALIAVDEIIGTLNYDIRDLDVRGSVLLDLIDYWREVKQEIEKL